MELILIYTSIDNELLANQMAADLVEAQLAACVQIQTVKSHYTWQGQKQFEIEYQLQIKTRKEWYAQVEEWLLKHHSYEVPEIIALPVIQGSLAYLEWVKKSTKNG
jgi:periplasmic divalent cation tolerance protein